MTIFVLALIYGAFINSDDPARKYAGLTLDREIEIDETTRTILKQRIATTRAAIDANLREKGDDFDWDLYLILAGDANLLGDMVLERETYEEFLEVNPIHYIGWNNYANVLRDMGDDTKAEEMYRKALELHQGEEFYRDLIDQIENTSNGERDDEVLAILKEGVVEVGQSAWFMVVIAQWYMAHDDCQQAFEHYDVAETLIPQNEGLILEIEEAEVTCAQQ